MAITRSQQPTLELRGAARCRSTRCGLQALLEEQYRRFYDSAYAFADPQLADGAARADGARADSRPT